MKPKGEKVDLLWASEGTEHLGVCFSVGPLHTGGFLLNSSAIGVLLDATRIVLR